MSTESMHDAAQEAHIVAKALPYLRRYAGATIVVKYGGHAMEGMLASEFGRDIALLKQVGINPVIVHGGGPQINAMLKRLDIKSEFVTTSSENGTGVEGLRAMIAGLLAA